jgi:hypothetical protein
MMRRVWRDYSLSIVTGGLFFVSWIAYAIAHWINHGNEVRRGGAAAETDHFLSEFLSRTFENWQGEMLHIFIVVLLTSYLVHKGSHEYETREALRRVEHRLEKLEARLPTADRG